MDSNNFAQNSKRQDPSTCDHPRLVKERIMGADTMDKKCAKCGKEFTPPEVRELEAKRAQKNP